VSLYAVDNVGFEEEGTVLVGTKEFVDHFRCGVESDRVYFDFIKSRYDGRTRDA
jgi:hypothetical protein